jgi:ParB-like chromosome segregation protein Spo0J
VKVHPFAEEFPMMSDDELDELADSIKLIGLQQPLVLDIAGKMLVEGRNRLEACKRAQVEPTYERLPEGTDPIEYILAANVFRRHLNPGQRAMAIALARLPKPERKEGHIVSVRNNVSLDDVAADAQTSKAMLHRAQIVRAYTPDLVASVFAKGGSLQQAYDVAKEARDRLVAAERALENAEKNRKRVQAAISKVSKDIELEVESAGVTVPIPEQPDLEMGGLAKKSSARDRDQSEDQLEAVKSQQAFMRRLNKIKKDVADLAEEEVVLEWSPELTVAGIRAAVSQIVASAYGIAQQYNAAIAEGRLRVLGKEA